ncbi:hypothetical protein GE061_011287 [Apolygus lucorum]|uniref:Uncharacterized protein n=1 Tax=Apolygus lucorum TaxID=248454 RepID=A0A8S9XZP0_APOLU|nr:hypothetical protein GE061_011287 [Apolygus lucorum]
MPRPKVYREYFPSCIERFFGGGRPRRIKARCFVPYTEAEENTDALLGPTPGAPNIDLNMMVVKDRNEDEDGSMPHQDETCSQRMDCGCKCRCSDNSSSAYSSSSGTSSSSDYRSTNRSKSVKGRPKILVLEDDGRYREIHDEYVGVHKVPENNLLRKSHSLKSAKLVMKDAKVDVICPSMPSPDSSTPAASEVFTWDECANIAINQERPEGSKRGVVLGYVMFDPDSDEKKLYVTTTDGRKITPATHSGNRY